MVDWTCPWCNLDCAKINWNGLLKRIIWRNYSKLANWWLVKHTPNGIWCLKRNTTWRFLRKKAILGPCTLPNCPNIHFNPYTIKLLKMIRFLFIFIHEGDAIGIRHVIWNTCLLIFLVNTKARYPGKIVASPSTWHWKFTLNFFFPKHLWDANEA